MCGSNNLDIEATMRFLFPAVVICSLFSFSAAYADVDANTFNRFSYNGAIDKIRIGLTIVEHNGKIVSPSHYYYFKYMTDISLVANTADNLALAGSDGGVFHLKFKQYANSKDQPASLENSTGFIGSWTSKEGKSYAVELNLIGSAPKNLGADRQYATITNRSDFEYESNPKGFYQSVMMGNRSAAARYIHFPLRFNSAPGKSISISSPQMLNKYWDSIFNKAWINAASETAPHDMNSLDGYAYIGRGLVYFDDQGAVSVNGVN